ncbi:MAG: serine/threonine-protein kinase, partial [Gemmataceae bacterium]
LYTFGFATLALVWGQYAWFHSGWLPVVDDYQVMHKFMELLGDSYSHPWFLLIVFYGSAIPNTARRCAWVVLGISVVCLTMLIVIALESRPLAPYIYDVTLPKTIFALMFGVAIAIYGSHHITLLRRASYEARKLGRYVLKEQLGQGGMGEVYLAEHQLLKRPCAVKIIRPEKAGDPRALLRFAREVQATAALSNPHVVEVYDYGNADDGTFYYVMEYLPGISLHELVHRFGAQPGERVVELMMQVCLALREAHGRGLIHRDIKPSNIIVGNFGGMPDTAKLVDFGLVSAPVVDDDNDDKLTQAGTVLGSPLYMSPEQVRGAAELDGRSDLYSLGLVGYFLLTGINPFKRANLQATFAAHLSDPAPRPCDYAPGIGQDLESIILRCLEKDPAARFADAESLRDTLAGCACAGRWTEDRARDWWRENLPE